MAGKPIDKLLQSSTNTDVLSQEVSHRECMGSTVQSSSSLLQLWRLWIHLEFFGNPSNFWWRSHVVYPFLYYTKIIQTNNTYVPPRLNCMLGNPYKQSMHWMYHMMADYIKILQVQQDRIADTIGLLDLRLGRYRCLFSSKCFSSVGF